VGLVLYLLIKLKGLLADIEISAIVVSMPNFGLRSYNEVSHCTNNSSLDAL
jgi:hypothetical protein